MVDAGSLQRKMNVIQNSDSISDLFGQLVSGKKGYKAVIEKAKAIPKCDKCLTVLEGSEKFCPECGNRVNVPK